VGGERIAAGGGLTGAARGWEGLQGGGGVVRNGGGMKKVPMTAASPEKRGVGAQKTQALGQENEAETKRG